MRNAVGEIDRAVHRVHAPAMLCLRISEHALLAKNGDLRIRRAQRFLDQLLTALVQLKLDVVLGGGIDLFRSPKKINSATQHDIKLELDVRCQKLIEKTLRAAYPQIAILGEEGVLGDTQAEHRWVVDPIDGTVNFTYGIPHCCVSIALQTRKAERGRRNSKVKDQGRDEDHADASYETVVGVVYDPFCDELWTAIRGHPAYLNGKIIRVSERSRLDDAIVSIGFAKGPATMRKMLPVLNRLAHRVPKVRIMG